MNLIVEVLDRKTRCWTMLACKDGVTADTAPSIVTVLRSGLSAEADLRWRWSRTAAAPGRPADAHARV